MFDTLKTSEIGATSILNMMPAMIGYWDENLCNLYGNDAYKFWFGIDPTEMRGKHIREVIGEERYQLNLPYIEGALKGIPQQFERLIPSPDGTENRYALANYIPDKREGRTHGFYVLITDITQLKITEAALNDSKDLLKISEARYRGILEDQTELISRFTSDGTFLFVNDCYCRFFGKAAESLLGKQWQPVVHPDDLDDVVAKVATLSASAPVITIENRVFNHCGEIRWMQFVNRGFFSADGQLIEIQSVGRDITERKNAVLALHQIQVELENRVAKRTEELRRLTIEMALIEERERQAIAQNLHDELGQILHILRIKMDTLAVQVKCDKKDQIDELKALISESSRLVRSLTAQLSPPVLKKLGLAAAFQWLQDEMAAQYGLTVFLECDVDKTELPKSESIILFRAGRELLFNVVKHANADTARMRLRIKNNLVLLEVEDNGTGLPASPSQTISANKFGLFNLKERINCLGGDVYIESPNQKGCRVTIRLSLSKKSPRATAA